MQGNTDKNREGEMSTVAKLAGAAVALGVVATVAVGGNYLWQRNFGPTLASKPDCLLAQQLFDKAQTPPADPAKAEAWEEEIRKVRYTMADDGLNTQVGKYAHWQVVKSTGQGTRPTPKQVETVLGEAKGHCRESGVTLVIPTLKF
jgi:hypothetical protein